MKVKGEGLSYIYGLSNVDGTFKKAKLVIGKKKFAEKRSVEASLLEFEIGRIGYVNCDNLRDQGAVFVARCPIRRSYKQGLVYTSLSLTLNQAVTWPREMWIHDNEEELEACMKNDFPGLTTAIETVEERGMPFAFSRAFAIGREFSLDYKGVPVGKVLSNNKLSLENKNSFLVEELAKEVGLEKISL